MSKATLTTADLRYQDRPELAEVFADTVQNLTFDGRTLRAEFCVARLDDPDPKAKKRTGRAVPVIRLVLDLDGAVDMFNKINSLQAALESRGVISSSAKAAPAPAPAGKSKS